MHVYPHVTLAKFQFQGTVHGFSFIFQKILHTNHLQKAGERDIDLSTLVLLTKFPSCSVQQILYGSKLFRDIMGSKMAKTPKVLESLFYV